MRLIVPCTSQSHGNSGMQEWNFFFFQTHPSVRIKGTENNYIPSQCFEPICMDKSPHMHCPFCVKTDCYTDPVILKAHYRVKHVDKGIEFAGKHHSWCQWGRGLCHLWLWHSLEPSPDKNLFMPYGNNKGSDQSVRYMHCSQHSQLPWLPSAEAFLSQNWREYKNKEKSRCIPNFKMQWDFWQSACYSLPRSAPVVICCLDQCLLLFAA